MNLIKTVVSVIMFAGWIIYLAGVADSNSLCNKVGKGDMTTSDLISSGPDSPDKSFMPLNDPWTLPTGSSMSSSSSASNQAAANQAAINQAIANAMNQGRKMLSEEQLFPTHGRALMGVTEDRCGWTYSFAWWTVALQGLATILAVLVSLGALSSVRHVVGPLLYVNTALLCGVAADLIPSAANYNAIKVKGKGPDAIYTAAAGIIITLVANFFWFLVPPADETVGGAAAAEAK